MWVRFLHTQISNVKQVCQSELSLKQKNDIIKKYTSMKQEIGLTKTFFKALVNNLFQIQINTLPLIYTSFTLEIGFSKAFLTTNKYLPNYTSIANP